LETVVSHAGIGSELKKAQDAAFIVNAYSYRNAGDAAIMLSTSQLLRDAGYTRVFLSTRYAEDGPQYAKACVEVIPPVVAFPVKGTMPASLRLLNFAFGALMLIVVLSPPQFIRCGLMYRRVIGRLFPRIRLLAQGARPVVAGGGYLYSSKRALNISLLHSLLSVWVCSRLHQNVICMPSSVGPLDRRIDKFLVEYVFKNISVTLRETKSIEASVKRPLLKKSTLCPDIAFYGHAVGTDHSPRKERDALPVVRIVAMDWSWSKSVSAEAMDSYIFGLARVGDILLERGIDVELGGHSAIPEHGQQDLSICSLIAKRMTRVPRIDHDCDVEHLARTYARVDVVLATRLHAAIMATSAETPTVVLGYQEKARGIVELWLEGTDWYPVDAFNVDSVVNSCVAALRPEAKGRVAQLSLHLKKQIVGAYSDQLAS
jgi:polysaccharide pyruvyl transferase WcaK-like protein